MGKYIKTAFSFAHTYILLIFLIGLPIAFYFLIRPFNLNWIFLGSGIVLEIALFIMYIAGLTKIETFKKRFNIQNYERFLDRKYFIKSIESYNDNVKQILSEFFKEAYNILNELNVKGINDIIAQALLNVVQLGESYSSLQIKIDKKMGTTEQREEMDNRNNKRLELIKSSYKALKELGGRLILMNDKDPSDEQFVLEQLSTMNEALKSEIEN